MLVKLKKEEVENYIDFVYDLSLDLSKSCYPTYADGIKTKEDFIRIAKQSFEKENEGIYLFYHNGKLEGWLHYYYIVEDKYFSFENIAIHKHMKEALEEFFKIFLKHFKGYKFYFGCSTKNKEAILFFKKKGFDKIEESKVCLFNFKEYTIQPENKNIKKITKDTYENFRKLHSLYDSQMYWDSDHILKDLENWYIYVYEQEGEVIASIYYVKSNEMLEIFGIDFKNKKFSATLMEDLMVKALNEGKASGMQHIYYFAENQEVEVLKKVGFHLFDTYLCYKKEI